MQVSELLADPPADALDIAEFVGHLAADTDRPSTTVTRWRVLRLIQHELGKPLSDATATELTGWWFGRGTRRHDGRARSPATRRTHRAHLAVFLTWACRHGWRADDPGADLPVVRVPHRQPRPAASEHVVAVLDGADARERRALLLASVVGLRCIEIAGVTRDDLHHDDGGWRLWVIRKGGHRQAVAVPPVLARELANVPAGQPIVPAVAGGRLSAAGVDRMIGRACARAGVTIRAHELRHLAATKLLSETDGDIRAVAEQLGHRDIRTTAGYTTPRPTVPDALARLDAAQPASTPTPTPQPIKRYTMR